MKAKELMEHLRASRKAVFNLNELAAILNKPETYTKVFMNRLAKEDLLRVERNKYTIRGTNPFLVASNIVFPSYISFLSAYSYFDLTTQIPRTIYVVSRRQRKGSAYDGTSIRFIRFDRNRFFGLRRETVEGKFLFVADVEKAIVDSVYLPEYCPVRETLFALRNAKLDVEKLLNFAERMRSLAMIKRLGFLLESIGIDESERWRSRFRNYTLLNPTLPRKGQRNEKWKLVINEVLD